MKSYQLCTLSALVFSGVVLTQHVETQETRALVSVNPSTEELILDRISEGSHDTDRLLSRCQDSGRGRVGGPALDSGIA